MALQLDSTARFATLPRNSRMAAAWTILISVATASPTPFTSISRSGGALSTSAKLPKRAINCLARGLVSPRLMARNSTISSSS